MSYGVKHLRAYFDKAHPHSLYHAMVHAIKLYHAMKFCFRMSAQAWQRLNILALDAPIIACTWFVFLASRHSVRVEGLEFTLLFLSVWVVYIIDRLRDSTKLAKLELSPRHLFYQQHRFTMLVILGMLVSIAGYLSIMYLAPTVLIMGSITALLCAGYLYTASQPQWLPKEITASLLFALGTSLLLWQQAPSYFLLWDSLQLAALCLLNMGLIALSDARNDTLQGQPSIAVRDAHWANHWLLLLVTSVFVQLITTKLMATQLITTTTHYVFGISQLCLLACYLLSTKKALSTSNMHSLADLSLLLPPLLAMAHQICYFL